MMRLSTGRFTISLHRIWRNHCAEKTVLTVHAPTLLAGGKNFTDAMSQKSVIDFDINGSTTQILNQSFGHQLF
jgi:hypothetical protein